MKRLVVLACLTLSLGCAAHIRTSPFDVELVVLYGRTTDCLGPVPTQLAPDFVGPPTPADLRLTDSTDNSTCHTVEVGAKSYADSIGALGAAAVAIMAKVVLF